ncbi:MAG: replication initiation protein [Janthinobacterium lividum]
MADKHATPKPVLLTIGNELAYQHNNLIRTPLKMGLIESRIFIQALSTINVDTQAFVPIHIPVTSVMRELKNGADYADIQKACDALVGRVLDLVPANEAQTRTHKIPLMQEVLAVDGTGKISVTFNNKAQPYLLQLKAGGNFTSADVATLLAFRNPNSGRLYWIIKSWAGLGSGSTHTKEITLSTLKSWLLANDKLYPIYTEFKRRVLDPIAAEFKKIGFNASWEPVVTGKKTTGIRFTIPRNKPKASPAKAIPTVSSEPGQAVTTTSTTSSKHELFYQKLKQTYGLAPGQVQVVTHYLEQGNKDQLKDRFNNVTSFLSGLDKMQAKGPLGNYVWTCLQNKYPFLKTLHTRLTTATQVAENT